MPQHKELIINDETLAAIMVMPIRGRHSCIRAIAIMIDANGGNSQNEINDSAYIGFDENPENGGVRDFILSNPALILVPKGDEKIGDLLVQKNGDMWIVVNETEAILRDRRRGLLRLAFKEINGTRVYLDWDKF